MGKKEILEKLSKGEISVEEAMKMEEEEKVTINEVPTFRRNSKFKYLVIKVTTKENNQKVHVRLPLALAKLAKSGNFKMGDGSSQANKILADFDIDEFIRIAEEEGTTKFVDVQSDDGENVEIFIE